MITFFEFKNNIKSNELDEIKNTIKKNGFVTIKLLTDDNKTQINQFEKIKKYLKYKPDGNLKFYWNNSNNFVLVDLDKIKTFEI